MSSPLSSWMGAMILGQKIETFAENIPKGPKTSNIFGPFGMFSMKIIIFLMRVVADERTVVWADTYRRTGQYVYT